MATTRHTLHLDVDDLKTLARLARAETKRVGSRVTIARLVRQAVKEFLRARRAAAER